MNGLGKLILIGIILTTFTAVSFAQEPFKVMFYNVENLYDTINNPKTLDDDLTPQGNLHWGSYRYHKKLEDVSKVISSLGGKYPPAIVGLCEIENASVLKDLTQNSSLAKHKYKYAITKSKDSRGSNIALLYQRDQFQLILTKSYTPIIVREGDRKTRDILHVVGKVVNSELLDIFVCHYPSRSEGVTKSRPLRIEVSKLLRQKVDSLYKIRRQPNIIIMGDFNDYPFDISMQDTLGARSLNSKIENESLYNMFLHHGKKTKDIASYKYKGKWNYLDQFIVSGNILDNKRPIHIIGNSAQVFSPKFLLEDDAKYGGKKPFRTFSGWTYLGGTSDHLPIYMDLYVKE